MAGLTSTSVKLENDVLAGFAAFIPGVVQFPRPREEDATRTEFVLQHREPALQHHDTGVITVDMAWKSLSGFQSREMNMEMAKAG